jgi:hypothetical protein
MEMITITVFVFNSLRRAAAFPHREYKVMRTSSRVLTVALPLAAAALLMKAARVVPARSWTALWARTSLT